MPVGKERFARIEQLYPSRVKQLYDELAFALSRTDRAVLRQWGRRAAGRLFHLGARRVGGMAQLVSGLARFGSEEAGDFYRALREERLGVHIGRRAAAAIDGTLAVGSEGRRLLIGIGRALRRNPKEMAPKVLGAFLGFNAGSGGIDGNGGIPDLDLLVGIGSHRSPLTHTIIAGILAEGVLLALVDLAAEIHGRLPHDHDPLWEGLARIGRPFAESVSISLSAGIAWHLLFDAGIQPAPYHDLPFSMPIEAHQAVFAANGVAEGVDALKRVERAAHGAALLVSKARPQQTTGERVVKGVSAAAKCASAGLRQTTDSVAQAIIGAARRHSTR